MVADPADEACGTAANEKYLAPSGDHYFVVVPLKYGLEGGHGPGATGRASATSRCGIRLPDPSCP